MKFVSTRKTTVDDVTKFLGGVRNLVSAQIYGENQINGLSLDEYAKKLKEETGCYIMEDNADKIIYPRQQNKVPTNVSIV